MFDETIHHLDPARIVAALRSEGYYAIPGALTSGYVDRLDREFGDLHPEINRNFVSPVFDGHQRYFAHCLAVSRGAFDLFTSDFLFSVMRGYFGSGFRLTDHRMYVTERAYRMPWHVDVDEKSSGFYPSLTFIFYMCDVPEGQLQLAGGSKDWNPGDGIAFSSADIERRYAGRIVDFKLQRGSLIIYDAHMIHRAAPILGAMLERKSLFFQVEKKAGGGSINLIDASFLTGLDAEKMFFLGFGATPEYPAHPQSSIRTMRPAHLIRTSLRLWERLPIALLRSFLLGLPPGAAHAVRQAFPRAHALYRRMNMGK